MRLKTLATAAVLALALCAAPAQARTHHSRCKPGYHRVKRHHRVRCVKRKVTVKPTAPRPVKLHAHLDPAYTRDPLNPFRVSYEYSASATQAPVTAMAALPTAEEPAPLPEGILVLYSDGSLECAMNVGGPTNGGECPVTYAALGAHRVTTIYTSGSVSATETSVEHIEPLATSLTISTSYEELEGVSTAPGEWHEIGTYTIHVIPSPAKVSVQLGCDEPATEPYGLLTANGCYLLGGYATVHARVFVWGGCESETPVLRDLRVMTEGQPGPSEPTREWPTAEQIKSGAYHLRAFAPLGPMSGNEGYATSEATTPLQINPAWLPACY